MSTIAVTWSRQFGLAHSPLFGDVDTGIPDGDHQVLLDGGFGTFALSTSTDELWRASDPAAWAWSSDVPHHVTVTDTKVAVVRWDKPNEPRVYARPSVERSLDRFYEYLNEDRLRSNRSVVDHLLGYFRRIRSLSHAAGLPDDRVTEIFTAALAELLAPDSYRQAPKEFGLADDAIDLLQRINRTGLAAANNEIALLSGGISMLRLHPALAIRHAGGQLFQEAHFELLRASPDFDLFGLMGVPEVSKTTRGGTHFTPPALARSLVEQALSTIPDLGQRDQLILSDPSCGSGAFLHEALRALRRSKFNGKLILIGHDVSPPAIAMARFVLSLSLRDWSPKGGVELRLVVGDSLGALGMPKADVVVMNPPFIAFGAQTPEQREQLRQATDSTAARGDYSMAFVTKALDALADGGVLGTLFPASLLSLKAASSWRERIANEGEITTLASIGDFGLFSHALVQVACAVIRKESGSDASAIAAIVTENDPAATSSALRQLRKLDGQPPSLPIIEEGWSLFSVEPSTLGKRSTWRLPTPSSERVLRALNDLNLPVIENLFDVAQGIQTGLNDILLLTEEEWRALPSKERGLFRLATMTDSIRNGRVAKPYRVFFPYSEDGSLFTSEGELADAVPTYYKTMLKPNRDRLAQRSSIVQSKRADWWGLMRSRSWAFDGGPRIITKFFGAEGGFVGDYDAQYVPVMGHVWTPKSPLLDVDDEGLPLAEILAGYVALFNSSLFIKLLGLYSPHVAGGQFDLSRRHVALVPVPDLRNLSTNPAIGRAIVELGALGRKVDIADATWVARTNQIVMGLYGADTLKGL